MVPGRMVFLMWLVYTLQYYYGWDLRIFGILPREPIGLLGIFTAPFIHGNTVHLLSNTVPLLVLGGMLYFFYEEKAPRVFAACYFVTNILVWIFGRQNIHIGASGLIYGLAAYLIFYGFFKKDFKSLLISFVVLFFYAGMVYGVFPTQTNVSWESHLAGAVVGAVTAMNMGRRK